MKKIIFLALFLRLLTIFVSRNIDNYDLQSYLQVGELTLNKTNIYPDIANLRHPYFPAFLYIEAFAYWLGNLEGLRRLGIITIIKIIISLFDLVNVYLVYLLSEKNLKKAFFYATNPIPILIFAFHGQFDSIPLFFLLLSLYLIKINHATREVDGKKSKKEMIVSTKTFNPS